MSASCLVQPAHSAQKAHERSANVGTGADHLRVTELGLSPPRPVWLLPPPSTQSVGGETNTERWVVWGPSLGLQPAPPLGTSVCVCVCARAHASVTRSCPTLCDPTDCSPPGSSGASRQEYSAGCHLLPQGPPEGTLVLTAVFLAVGSLPESLLQLTLPPPTMATHQGPKGRDPHAARPPGVQHSDGRPEGPTFCLSDVFSAGSR